MFLIQCCQQVTGFKQHHRADYWGPEPWGTAGVNQCQGRREVQALFSEMLLSELMVQSLLNLFLQCLSVHSQPGFQEETQGCSGFCVNFIWPLCNCCSARKRQVLSHRRLVIHTSSQIPSLAVTYSMTYLPVASLLFLWVKFLLVTH